MFLGCIYDGEFYNQGDVTIDTETECKICNPYNKLQSILEGYAPPGKGNN